MPRAYCGLISLTLIKRILADHDALFGGVSPDIYSAALISAHSVNALDIDFPAVIPGASGASTAGQSAAGRHVGALRDNDHIRSEEHTSELQSLMLISYAVFCFDKNSSKKTITKE